MTADAQWAEGPPANPIGTRPGAFRRLSEDPVAVSAFGVLCLILAVVIAAPVLPLADPNATNLSVRLIPPLTEGHLLGTDQLGRDIFSRLIWGSRTSLAVGFAAACFAAVIGSAIGLFAGFYGRWPDMLLMRCVDVLMAFPYLLLALAIVAALGPSLVNAMIAIVIVNIPFFARTVRGTTLGLVHADFFAAARLSGRSNFGIIVSELLPNVMPVIVVTISTSVGWMILETAGLSFLGLGAQPPQADLGGMLSDGRNLIAVAPHVALIPGLTVLVLAIAINLIGDGVRDIIDPRLKSGGMARSHPATAVVGRRTRDHLDADVKSVLALVDLKTYFTIGRQVFRAVDGVSLNVAPGEAVGIVGESGAGKTATALSVLRLVPTPPGAIVGGSILYRGEDLVEVPLSRLQRIRGDRIASVFQDPRTTLNPIMPVGEQIAEAVRQHQGVSFQEAASRAVKLMEAFRIPEAADRAGSYPHEFSGGQCQRIGIAMALANDPEIIIADEPTTALDVTTQAQILELLRDIRRTRDTALVFISHDVGVIGELCDTVNVMYAGRIVESGPVAEVFSLPAHPYTQMLLACALKHCRPERSFVPIPGAPPPADALPTGCAFAPRCSFALDACRMNEVAPVALNVRRWARCIRAREFA